MLQYCSVKFYFRKIGFALLFCSETGVREDLPQGNKIK